jgi:hypothetical protein
VQLAVAADIFMKNPGWELVGLSMSLLQICLFGPYLSSFSAHNHGYEPSNEHKS